MYKKTKAVVLIAVFLVMTSCTTFRKVMCTGCLEPLTEKEVKVYQNTSLTKFINERFTSKFVQIIGSRDDVDKVNKKDGSVVVQLLSYHVTRPYYDFDKYCSVKGGELNLLKKGQKLTYRSTEEIRRDTNTVYKNSLNSAPKQVAIDSGFGLQTTYDINKEEYAQAQAQSFYQSQMQEKAQYENSLIAKLTHEGKFGSYICKKGNHILWGVEISYSGQRQDGIYTWYNIKVSPQALKA